VVPGGPDTLAGKRFDSAAHGQDVVIPFDLLALVYYTDPSSDKLPEQLKLPVKDRYPEPKGTGAAEEALSCEALDVELARAEALRWVARSNGAVPYTSGEKLALHAKHTAIDIGVALLVLAGGVGGSGGAEESTAGTWAVNEEGFRWAVSATDERMAGLLKIKEHKSCAGRASLQADTSDLWLWHSLEVADQPSTAARPDERAVLTRRTAVFDLMGPKAVAPREAEFPLPAGETGVETIGRAFWFADVDYLARGFWHASEQIGKTQVGTLVLTDQHLLMRVLSRGGVALKSGEISMIEIPYAQISSVGVESKALNCEVVITRRNGHVDSLQIVPHLRVNREKTEAVAKALQAKLAVNPAVGTTP